MLLLFQYGLVLAPPNSDNEGLKAFLDICLLIDLCLFQSQKFTSILETENKLHKKTENEAIHKDVESDLQRELRKTENEEEEKSMSAIL